MTSPKRAANGRARPMAKKWVFGGIDTTTDDAFIVEVQRHDTVELMRIIQQWIAPGKQTPQFLNE